MTRLFYETKLKDFFPGLIWVRVCTTAPFVVTVFACDANLELPEDVKTDVLDFLNIIGSAGCRHDVRHYFDLQDIPITPIGEIPDVVKNVALNGKVDKKGVIDGIKAAFSSIISEDISTDSNTVYFSLKDDESLSDPQILFLEARLTEIIPAGSVAKIRRV